MQRIEQPYPNLLRDAQRRINVQALDLQKVLSPIDVVGCYLGAAQGILAQYCGKRGGREKLLQLLREFTDLLEQESNDSPETPSC
jgi:hypothetical protein